MENYWIFKVADDENEKYRRKGIEIYKHRMPECFWGLKEFTKTGRRAPNVAHLKAGDFDMWAKPLPIERLRGKVHFVPKNENYGSYLQGSVTKIHYKRDFDTVVREHELDERGRS